MKDPSPISSAKSGNDLDLYAVGNVENTPELNKSVNHEGLSRSHTQPNFSTILSHPLNNNKLLPTKVFYYKFLNFIKKNYQFSIENNLFFVLLEYV